MIEESIASKKILCASSKAKRMGGWGASLLSLL
jgi:hypothetical protein